VDRFAFKIKTIKININLKQSSLGSLPFGKGWGWAKKKW
jgi:hypothetical protein